jgi:hypothetical protein
MEKYVLHKYIAHFLSQWHIDRSSWESELHLRTFTSNKKKKRQFLSQRGFTHKKSMLPI